MTETWTAPQAERTDPGRILGEHQALEAWPDFHRDTLLLKRAGLTADQLKERAVPRSRLSLLGLVRHMTENEHWWLRTHAADTDLPFPYDPDQTGHDFEALADADAAANIEAFKQEIDHARAAVAAVWPERTWAVEGAAGLGHLLAWQLLAAGERVLDVQPRLGARVRLLAAGATNKNDPNDARSVAVAALRSVSRRQVSADDHAAVLTVRAERHRDLGRTRTQVACRLHAVLCELVPGGIAKRITAAHAAGLLERITPAGTAEAARCELAAAFCEDLRRIDDQMRDAKKKLTVAVTASGTTVTEVFGACPVVAAIVIGGVGDASRFPSRDHFAACNGTAPIEVSSGHRKIYRLSRRGNRRLNHAIHMAAVTQISHRHGDGRACYERKLAEGKTPKEALRALKRQVSDAIFARLQADARQTTASSR